MNEYLKYIFKENLVAATEPMYEWDNIINLDLVRRNEIITKISQDKWKYRIIM